MRTKAEMNKNEVIPVFFSTDNNYLPFLSVALRSMIDNLNPETHCRVHILNDGLCEEGKVRLTAMQTEAVKIEFVDVRPLIEPLLEKLNLRDYYTPSIYYRLFIPTLFPQYSRAIYLDADIAVTGDITKLYNIPLGERLVGAVSDAIIASHEDFRFYAEGGLGIPYYRYFNSGVLVMNLDQFRLQGIKERFTYLLETYRFETVCPDQDYLNELCYGQVLYLDNGWNKMSIDRNYIGMPSLIHYNMFFKPWQYDDIAYGEIFWEYAKKTAYYEDICKIRASFGIKNRLSQLSGNKALHRNARRIAQAVENFRTVLHPETVEEPQVEKAEMAYEF